MITCKIFTPGAPWRKDLGCRLDHAGDGEALAHPLRTRFAEPLPKSDVVSQPARRGGERRDIADLCQEAALARVDARRGSARGRCDDGHARRERLDRDNRSPLVRGGEQEGVECGIQRADVVAVAEHPDAVCEAGQTVRKPLDRCRLPTVTCDDEQPAVHRGQRADEVFGPLDRRQASRPADDEAVVTCAEPLAPLCTP